jgi:hypothetical protein
LQGELSRQQDISGAQASGHFFKLAAASSLNASLAKKGASKEDKLVK